jgi:hypothetical protein
VVHVPGEVLACSVDCAEDVFSYVATAVAAAVETDVPPEWLAVDLVDDCWELLMGCLAGHNSAGRDVLR